MRKRTCQNEDDAVKLVKAMLYALGYTNAQLGPNVLDVRDDLTDFSLTDLARNAESVGRWARVTLSQRQDQKP